MQKSSRKTKSSRPLVVFDVDQTLVRAFDVHDQATNLTLKEIFGIDGWLEDVDYEGQTVETNLTNICKAHKIKRWVISKYMPKAIRVYDKNFAESLKLRHKNMVLPGAIDLLERIKKTHDLAIVTGGTPRCAKALLRHVNLLSYFKTFVFGNTSQDRAVLLAKAIKKAGSHKDITAIGDSVRDIDAAKANGVRIISVLTGSTQYTRLKSRRPDYIARDLRDPNLRKLLGGHHVG